MRERKRPRPGKVESSIYGTASIKRQSKDEEENWMGEQKDGKELKPFASRVWLSTPTMHGPELEYIKEAYETNWMSTVGDIEILGRCPYRFILL